ncbi:MAG: hypothetical protein IKU15_04400 [Clostridia bacterium]|nr:hypothetical protein [Clostridia bacterium]
MKKHNLCRSFIACLLAVTMLLGTCGTVFATEVASNEIVYVSFGDSMTNGYGLAGYNGNNGVLDYGTVSYSNQFADWLVEEGYADSVDHKQLAMSGLRAEDLHWFLELDHESEEIRNYLNDISSGWTWDEEDWYSVFNIGDYRTHGDMCSDRNRSSAAASNILASGYDSPYATQAQKDAADCLNYGTAPEGEGYVHYTNNNQAAIVAEYYQNAVKNADIISMAVGNSNFGTFMFDQIVNAVGYHGAPEDAMNFSIERALTECPAELKETVLDLKDKLYLAIEDYLGIELDYEEGADYIDGEINHNNMTAAIANAAVYAGISYVLNYAGSVDAILKLNPDVEIIQVALMNTYLNTSATSEESTIGSLLDVMFPPINAFIAALPTVMKGAKNEVYEDATFYYAEAPEVACMVEVYGTDFYNEDGTCNRGSITRQRFFSDLLPLIGGMVGNADTFGAPLNYSLPFEELCLYDEMDDNAKAAYAYANTSNAVTCAVYLAFEKATVAGGQQAAVTLDSIMDLGDISFAQFADAAADFYDNMAENVPLKMPVAMGAIAAVFNAAALTDFHLISELDANDVGAVYLADAADKLNTAKAVVQSIADDPRNAAVIEAMAKDGVYAQIDYETIYAGYASANSIPYTWEQFKLYGGAQYAAFVEGVKAQAWTNYGTAAITQAKNTIVNESADILVSSVDYVEKLSKLLALPDSLGDAMADDEKAVSWFGLCARCVIGDGLGGHPAPAGHDSLFDAVKTSY